MAGGGGPQIIMVWVVALTLCVAVASAWYITKPITDTASDEGLSILEGMDANDEAMARANSTYDLLEMLTTFWGPITIIVILIFAVIGSAAVTVSSSREAYY